MQSWLLTLLAALVVVTSVSGSRPVEAQSFYDGKTVRIIVGLAPGGGFDTYARLIARHMGKHIPGNPTIIVENMPGAGSLISANHIYKVAKPDGLTVAKFNGSLMLARSWASRASSSTRASSSSSAPRSRRTWPAG